MKHSNLLILAVLFVLGGAQSYGQEKITLSALLNEMVDRKEMSYFPTPQFTTKQFSSYDRASTDPSDQETWFANKDYSHFVREEENEGRLEKVMFEDNGAGAITRFWFTGATDHIMRIYIDGAEEPAFEGLSRTLIGGKIYPPSFMKENGHPERFNLPLAPPPLSYRVNPGFKTAYNLYLPLPYAKSCKVTVEQKEEVNPGRPGRTAIFYAINYRSYEKGTKVQSISPDVLAENAALITRVSNQLAGSVQNDIVNPTVYDKALSKTYEPTSQKILEIEGPNTAIYNILIQFDSKAIRSRSSDFLRSTVIEMIFDGKRTVWCPLGSFFGTGFRMNEAKSWYTHAFDQHAFFWSHYVKPFQKNAKLIIHNLGEEELPIGKVTVTTGDYEWIDGRSMYFGSSWQQMNRVKSGYKETGAYDFNYVTLSGGKGVYVADNLALINRDKPQWWGEGDEKIYIDGETFPSHWGTGTEDYYGYAFCSGTTFNHPFINQPHGGGNHPGHAFKTYYAVNGRCRALDRIPFQNSIKVDMEQWHAGETVMDYEPTTFFYIQEDVESSVKPQIEHAKRPVELE